MYLELGEGPSGGSIVRIGLVELGLEFFKGGGDSLEVSHDSSFRENKSRQQNIRIHKISAPFH